jgi:hypothetical protein
MQRDEISLTAAVITIDTDKTIKEVYDIWWSGHADL